MSVTEIPQTDHLTPTAPPGALEDPSMAQTVIEPRPGWQAINLAELWSYRELIYFLTWRDIKVRYKQTVMGAMWAVLQPLMTSFVFVILFGVMGGMKEDTVVPYMALVFCGQIAWQFFQSSVTTSGQSLVNSSNLISKVYFPRLIVPMAATGAAFADFLISLGVMGLMLAWYLLLPPVQVLLLPLLIVGVVMTAIGVGSFISALMVAYRDIRYVVPFVMQMWMFATPVGYPLKKIYDLFDYAEISQSWLPAYFFLNPLAGYVQGFRWCLLGEPLAPMHLALAGCSTCLVLITGALYFRRVERRFADIV